MEYTTNFSLKKPIRGVDPRASIDDLNDNAEDIDTIMYQNRTMLAPAFDPDKVGGYTEGDFVVQLGQYYECVSDTSGVWDPTAWQLTDIGTVLKALADGGGGGGGHTYSTQEQVVGKWIDGSDIYEQTIIVDSGFSATMTVAHGIANIDKIIDVEGMMETSHPAWLPLTDNVPVSGYNVTVEGYNRTNFSVYIGSSRVSDVVAIYVTLRYTKSTVTP